MNTRALLPFLALLFLAAATAPASTKDADIEGAVPGRWTQDYQAAVDLAKKENLPILLKFTGSDWCGLCMIMERVVFSTDEFAEWADGRVLLITIDQPHNEALVPEKYRDRNRQLTRQFNVAGVPHYFVLAGDGTKLGHLGYSRDATAGSFIADFERIAGGSLPSKDAAREAAARRDITVPDPALALAYSASDPAFKPLEQMVAALIESLRKKKEECEKKEETLRKQMGAALERARVAAQNKGDLYGMFLFDEAEKDPDATLETDHPVLLDIFKTRDQARAGYRASLDQDRARILSVAVEQLEKTKSEETRKGNIVLAKEVETYQKTVQKTLEGIQKRIDAAVTESGAAKAAAPAAEKKAGPADIRGSSRNITVLVNKENGASLGRFEKGEILVLQYLSGTYRPYRNSNQTVNPDVASGSFYSSGPGPISLEGPLNSADKKNYAIPKGTAQKPFFLVIPDTGHFNLKCRAGQYSDGKVTYKVTKMNVLEARDFQKSYDKDAFQTR